MSLLHPIVRASLVVAVGGFLLGFDSVVFNGVVEPVRTAFDLDAAAVGFAASCLIFGAMVGNALAGPMANRFGRRTVLQLTALLFTASAVASALAPTYWTLVAARVLGGFGVGGAILIAPIYIAEIAPPKDRGRLVSFNQLNIVIGISAAFFSNYFIDGKFTGDSAWRWMLGVEAVPAALYLLLLFGVPRSPRWLMTQGRTVEAQAAAAALGGDLDGLGATAADATGPKVGDTAGQLRQLLSRPMGRILTIALGLAFFQQITGINAIFYYAATIFEKAGAATESALRQGILIGLVNLGFTLVAMRLIDRIGRKPLLLVGSAGMAVALLTTGWGFKNAEYVLAPETLASLAEGDRAGEAAALAPLGGQVFDDYQEFKQAVADAVDGAALDQAARDLASEHRDGLLKGALVIDGALVLVAIMLFIASFAVSLGPVMWAMLSEVFPQGVRGAGISLAGLFNSLVSFTVVQLFPWELDALGPATTFFLYGVLAAAAFVFTVIFVPETKGRSLEELELELVRR